MAKMRLLSIKKKKSKRKDSRDEWLLMTDPVTNEEDQLRISMGSFNSQSFCYDPSEHLSEDEQRAVYEGKLDINLDAVVFSDADFFRQNNILVRGAVNCGYEPGEKYDEFFELGLRACQQISEKLRRITVMRYEELKHELKQELASYAVQAATQKRDSRLDQLVEQSANVSEEDKGTIVSMVEQLNQQKVELSKDRPLMRHDLDIKIENMMSGEDNELMEYFPQVDDTVKARFLGVMRYAQLHDGKTKNFGEFVEEIYTVMQGIGVEASTRYLDILHNILEQEDNDSFMTWTFNAAFSYIENYSPEQKNLYFEVLARTLQQGMTKENVWIAMGAAELLENKGNKRFGKTYNLDKVKQIVDQAFDKGSEKGVDDYLNHCKHHGVE